MIAFFVHDATGRIIRTGSAPTEAAAMLQAIEPGETVRVGGATEADWWDGSAVVPRPVPPAPPALVAGVEAVWSGLPIGVVVSVDPLNGADPVTGEADAQGDLSLTLPAGPWRLSVAEAFPGMGGFFDIEVTTE